MRRSPAAAALLALLALSLLIAACGGSDSKDEAAATATPTESAAPADTPTTDTGCQKVSAPKPKGEQKLPKPTLKLDPSKTYVAVVDTSCGTFEITLDVKRAPKTSASFASLAKQGFFDGLTFHRVVAGFVIQGGDPLGTGEGGPGYSIHEAPPQNLQYTRGVVAMAKTGAEPPGTSGSQFFVVTGEDAGLPPDYALVGKVTKGEDVVDLIGTVDTNQEQPVDPVVINSIKIQ
jgi:peptidyl-prolyl cis-trans isomerase B (cyclophilin B)